MTPEEIATAKEAADKLQAILNLACTVMSRSATPAIRERAETMLLALVVEEEVTPWEFIRHPKDKTWLQFAREACPNWRTL